VNRASRIADPDRVIASIVEWEADPDDVMWLRATFETTEVYLRINNFPDENLYSLWVGDDQYVELGDMPIGWSRVGPLSWPPSARPRRR